VPALLSSLINVPREELSAVLAPGGAPRPCLRDWLAGVLRSRRYHQPLP